MRQPIKVLKLAIIGGQLILLMIVAVACDDPEPTAAPTTATTATVTTPEPSPTPVSVEALVEATAASMRALESAHIEEHITMTSRVTGEEGTVEMSMVGDYQAPDRTRLSVSLTMEGNDFQADIHHHSQRDLYTGSGHRRLAGFRFIGRARSSGDPSLRSRRHGEPGAHWGGRTRR